MKKDLWRLWAITFLGFWTFVLPVLGFPRAFKSVLFSISGLAIALLSFFTARSVSRSYIHHEDVESTGS